MLLFGPRAALFGAHAALFSVIMPSLALQMPEDHELEEFDTLTWPELARDQLEKPAEMFASENMEEGDVYALLDRASPADETWRRVFVLIDTDHAIIFDENGKLIDEPSAVVGGRQVLRGAGGFFYRNLETSHRPVGKGTRRYL